MFPCNIISGFLDKEKKMWHITFGECFFSLCKKGCNTDMSMSFSLKTGSMLGVLFLCSECVFAAGAADVSSEGASASALIFFVLVLFLLFLAGAGKLFLFLQRRQLDVAFGCLPQRVCIVNRKGRIVYRSLPDIPSAEVIRQLRHLFDLPTAIREMFVRAADDVFSKGRSVEFDYVIEGQPRRVKFSLLESPFGARWNKVIWISHDATERQLSQLSRHFRQALEAIADGVIVADTDGRITLVNPAGAQLLGYHQVEAMGMRVEDIFRLETLEDVEQDNPFGNTLLTGRDGVRRRISTSQAWIREANDTISGRIHVFRDVTEECRKMDQLRVHSSLLDTFIIMAEITYFRIDREMKLIYASSTKYWPVENGSAIPINQWVVPEDVPELTRKWTAVITGELSDFQHAYSVLTGGERKYFELRLSRIKNVTTGQIEFCGVIQDITRIRENERRYLDNLRLLETVIEHLPGFFFVKDANDNFRYLLCNAKFEEITGKPASEIVGHFDPEIFELDAAASRKFMNDDRRLVAGNTDMDSLEQITNPQNRSFVVRTVKKVVPRADGGVLLLGMGSDITLQYELEQEQRRTIARLNEYIGGERVLNQLLGKITLEMDFETAVREMMRSIGDYADADRVYVFHYLNENMLASNLFEWCREGIEPMIDNLQNVDMGPMVNWHKMLHEHRPIIITDTLAPPEGLEKEASDLRHQDIKSLLVCGIWIGGALYGFIGVDHVRYKKDFSDCEVHTVNGIARMYQLAYDRARQRMQLEDSVSLQRQIVDNILLPITILDLDYTVLAANPSAVADAGCSHEELLGTKCYNTICKNMSPPDFCPVQRTLLSQEPCRVEHDFKTQRQISTSQPIFDRNGKMQYILTVDIDITEQTRQKKELQIAMEQAQAADRAKSYFLATVSHELRTPLNAVIGFSELLQQGGVDPDTQKDYLHSISFAGTALLNLVNDVLDLSKLAADQVTLVPARTAVAELVREVASVFKLKSKEKGLDLRVDISRAPHVLFVDNLRLRQILFNLLGNAFKFTHSGYIAIDAETFIEEGASGAALVIRVSDTGIGISKEGQKNIFDPFVQDCTIPGKRMYEGTGLGLSIIKKLLEKMGGVIELQSEPGEGSVFTVRIGGLGFEEHAVPALPAPISPESSPRAEEPRFAFRVLIVDDIPINLKVLRGMLKKLGIECTLANSAAEAFGALEEPGACYDAVLTDMWMPETSGAELAVRIRKDARFASIPVYVVTADTQVAEADAKKFSGILHKPITLESLDALFQGLHTKR